MPPRHVLNVKYDMGLFNDPYSHLGPKDSDPQDTNAESRLHRKEAREVARESLVLLKNRLDTLPLKKSGNYRGGWRAGGQQARHDGQLVRGRGGRPVGDRPDRHQRSAGR